ncbi:MAG: LDCC motif putative metal-binding protein [Desulfatiglandales bacterium]
MTDKNDKEKDTDKPKGWWARFLDRMARANEEALKHGCRT